ncbi:MAG: class I SAM-dependent methyltransferase family protein [archaeon]
MAFKDILKEKIAIENSELLPNGFQNIGDIIILNLDPKILKNKDEIGKAILKIFPRIRTVCVRKGGIKGKYRKPQLEVIAGEKNTETIHLENGIYYKLDISKIMFAKGNINEKKRIAFQVKKNEVIVDMFAGIGYFTLGMAKNAWKVYSIELNPVAYKYLKENILLNKLKNVEVIKGDCIKEIGKLVENGIKADRVMMGYLPPPKNYLKYAFKIINKKGVIHYETLVNINDKAEDIKKQFNEIKKIAEKESLKVKLLRAVKVKGYSPGVEHFTFDMGII